MIIQLPGGLVVGKAVVAVQRIEGIAGVQRLFPAAFGLPFQERGGRLGHPEGEDGDFPAALYLFDNAQHVLDLIVAVGQDVAFAGASLFSGSEAARRHVADVYEIVSAPDTSGEFALDVGGHQLDEVVARPIVGPEDAGGMHHHGVQSALDGVQHDLGGLGFGLGVAADNGVGGEMIHFFQHLQAVLFGDGVHRADIDQSAHLVREAELGHVAGAADVDSGHRRRSLGGNVDDAGGMDHDDLLLFGIREKGFEARLVADVAVVVAHEAAVLGLLGGEDQPADGFARFFQQPDNDAAQVAVGAGDNVELFHRGCFLSL